MPSPLTRTHARTLLQMLSLMDRLLKRENLDLRLTPYKVGLVRGAPEQYVTQNNSSASVS